MVSAEQMQALKDYAREVRNSRRAHPNITEPGLAPRFQRLIEDLIPTFANAPELAVIAEFQNPSVGRPDLGLASAHRPASAFIELKSIDKAGDPRQWRDAHDKRQFVRFGELPHWAISNFHEFRLYERDELEGTATLIPLEALDPYQADRTADAAIDAHDADRFLGLLERLVRAQPPQARNAEELAQLLAHSARLVREIVRDRLAELREAGETNTPLQQVRQEFRDVLYAHPEAGGYAQTDFDDLFSAAFAQTLAFGLLLVREATGQPVDAHAAQHMPDEHPLMKTTLGVLSMAPVIADVGAGFDVMIDTINGFDLAILGMRRDGSDPILYFYENFLETFDPEARERYGVYYTPVQVVKFMVGALDRALRDNLGTDGLADENVHILDPATGTGTFLLAIADRLRRDVEARHGRGQVPAALKGLAGRMYGFELLVGPYAVAHYRLHHALAARDIEEGRAPVDLPRLGVYLTDTLARPNADAPAGALGFVTEGMQEERREANRIKNEQEILAIIGNPPYRRLQEGETDSLVGRWMAGSDAETGIWTDLKQPVRDAGKGGQLNTFPELSVAFWRWAIWKLFEADNAPRRGVVAYISNRKYLTGWPYAGLRKMMREKFDRIEIIDLRGDGRLGARAGVEPDQNVFNILVGVAITICIADGSKEEGALAEVRYKDVWEDGVTTRRAKLAWLLEGEEEGTNDGWVAVERGVLENFRPLPFMNGELVSLHELFEFHKSGMKSGNDPVFVSTDGGRLRDQVEPNLIGRAEPEYREEFVRRLAYRPLDNRVFYNDLPLLNRPGPQMQSVWGEQNVGLYGMPSGTLEGPAAWCHGLLPDYHAFRGSYGGYAFPLYDRREGQGPFNVKSEIVEALGAAYGEAVTPEAAFDAMLCLLSATSYTTRFAEDLEDVFPHIPFPADKATFDEAVRIGAAIRGIETFADAPGADYARLARADTAPEGPLGSVDWDAGELTLCDDGSGRIVDVPEAVWRFEVSGYRVLPRWLAARKGLGISQRFIPELRDIVARIAALIDLFDEADTVLDATLADTLTRAALGMGHEEGGDDG